MVEEEARNYLQLNRGSDLITQTVILKDLKYYHMKLSMIKENISEINADVKNNSTLINNLLTFCSVFYHLKSSGNK